MRNRLRALVFAAVFGLVAMRVITSAAEKERDWKDGVLTESNPAMHTIASAERSYLVRGTIGDADPAPGTKVRFAVDGKTMYVALAGREFKVYVLGERVASATVAASSAASAPNAAPDAETLNEALTNDGVVKMILGGLKEDTVVRVIEARPGKFVLTKEAVSGLKAAGVPDVVIAAMSAKMSGRR